MSNRADALYRAATEYGGKAAVVFEGKTWTFSDLLARSQSYAAGLQRSGFERGDKLGLMLASRPDFIALQYAVFILGGTILPLNVFYQGHEIEHALSVCEADHLVLDSEFAQRLKSDIGLRCPTLRQIRVFGGIAEGQKPLLQPAEDLLGSSDQAPPREDLPADAVPMMLYTSATTGKAKGVMLTVGNLQANYDASPSWLLLSHDDVLLCPLPLYNTFALNQCINASISLAATMVMLPRFDPLACMQAIARYRCTFFPAVPTMLQRVLYHPEVENYDLSSLRRFCVGAAPVPAPLLARLHERIGTQARVLTGYGLTEATAIVATHEVKAGPDGELIRAKSIGLPLPGIEMAIWDESCEPVPDGTVGEICVKGPCVMKGYYKMPEASAEALVRGWLRTGDLGTRDSDGYYAIVDRKKDLIIRGGQNIYPADIEEALYRHPAVAEAAVVARPDESLGEVPTAFVALKPGAQADSASLLAHCKADLAYFKVPDAVAILPELPKGPTGKILRRELRQFLSKPTT